MNENLNGWIKVSDRNPKVTGSFPVIVKGKPNEWATGFFDTGDNSWGDARFDPTLIVPAPMDVEFWFPLRQPEIK